MKTYLTKTSEEMTRLDWKILDDDLFYKKLSRLARLGITAAIWDHYHGG